MKDDLEPAKKILRAFLNDIEEVKEFRKNTSSPTSALSFTIKDQEPVVDPKNEHASDTWKKENAYMWLYADAWEYRSLMHRPKPHPISKYYSQPAQPLYLQWRQEEKEVFYRKCEKIPLPAEGVTLIDYLQQLALTVSEGNEHRDVWIESLRCFLQFLRDDTELDQRGPLEILFPSRDSCKGMEFRKGFLFERHGEENKKVERRFILRRIEQTVYPIDILAASEILMHLSEAVFKGRRDSQYSAAEALGFAWLCHAVGCYRLTTREDLVFGTELCNLRPPDLTKSKEYFKPTRFVGITSLFSVIDVPISETLYNYLLALPRDPKSNRIFNINLDSISRTFRTKGVKQSECVRSLGQITFLTFMSQPHEAIGQRSFLKQKFYEPKKLSATEQSE